MNMTIALTNLGSFLNDPLEPHHRLLMVVWRDSRTMGRYFLLSSGLSTTSDLGSGLMVVWDDSTGFWNEGEIFRTHQSGLSTTTDPSNDLMVVWDNRFWKTHEGGQKQMRVVNCSFVVHVDIYNDGRSAKNVEVQVYVYIYVNMEETAIYLTDLFGFRQSLYMSTKEQFATLICFCPRRPLLTTTADCSGWRSRGGVYNIYGNAK